MTTIASKVTLASHSQSLYLPCEVSASHTLGQNIWGGRKTKTTLTATHPRIHTYTHIRKEQEEEEKKRCIRVQEEICMAPSPQSRRGPGLQTSLLEDLCFSPPLGAGAQVDPAACRDGTLSSALRLPARAGLCLPHGGYPAKYFFLGWYGGSFQKWVFFFTPFLFFYSFACLWGFGIRAFVAHIRSCWPI